MSLLLHKIRHWEYWPAWLIYLPVSANWLYYSIRSGSLFFFNRVNPGIPNGGMLNVSKMSIYSILPDRYCPKTSLVKAGTSFEDSFAAGAWSFPLFVKPDKGLRGTLVKRIDALDELKEYHHQACFDYLIQEHISYPLEIGLFYIKIPGEPKGRITGIVEKVLPFVIGDGQSSLKSLMAQDPRLRMQIAAVAKEYPERLHWVPEAGHRVECMPYGNHCRGALFLDQSHRISQKLEEQFNRLCVQIPGFYYGRLDIKFNSWHALEAGEQYKIIELNGALSEPAHMYDPKHTFLKGQKEIFRHFHCMYRICRHHQLHGMKALSWREGLHQLKEHFKSMESFRASVPK